MFYTLLYILSYDIWLYFSHVVLHSKRYYHIHKEHHTRVTNLKYPDTFVANHLETLIQPLGVFIPLMFYPVSIYLFLKINILILIRGMMRHDERCIWLIGNHHILHHKYPQYNYGEYWLDKLFKTNYPNKDECIEGLIYLKPFSINF